MRRTEIRIRDPFILTERETGTYYMYGTTDLGEGYRAFSRFSVYLSRDLEEFEGPFPVFDGERAGFWATMDYWAAEVHRYRGKYYLFGSFKAPGRCRGTQILVSDTPRGPFLPISDDQQTPQGWECLDGTLWVEGGTPYLVFCHEWLQCVNGEIWAVALTEDLTRAKSEPFLLFRAGDHPSVGAPDDAFSPACRVTDGPFLYRLENGLIRMIWSSFASGRYQVLEAEAEHLHGSWRHLPPRFAFDGGHAMIFTDFGGKRYLSLHRPNTPPDERPVFLPFDSDQAGEI